MSNDNLMLDVGQANELKMAFRRYNYTNELIKRLSEGDILERALMLIEGKARIHILEPTIDCDEKIQHLGLNIIKHKKMGLIKLTPEIFKSKLVKTKRSVGLAWNANVLDYLLKYKYLIDDLNLEKNKEYFFLGTTYCNPGENTYFRYLCWDHTFNKGKGDWRDGLELSCIVK